MECQNYKTSIMQKGIFKVALRIDHSGIKMFPLSEKLRNE